MQTVRRLFSSISALSRGRARWGIAAVLVVSGPLLVLAAVRHGANAPPPKEEAKSEVVERSATQQQIGRAHV